MPERKLHVPNQAEQLCEVHYDREFEIPLVSLLLFLAASFEELLFALFDKIGGWHVQTWGGLYR